jgi:hypothetical protein
MQPDDLECIAAELDACEAAGDMDRLGRLIHYIREQLGEPGHQAYAHSYWQKLAETLLVRYELTRDPATMRESLDAGLKSTPFWARGTAIELTQLLGFGMLLAERYEYSQLDPLADAADQVLSAAVKTVPEDDPAQRAQILVNIAALFVKRYLQTRKSPDAARAVQAAREALTNAYAQQDGGIRDHSLFYLSTALLLLGQQSPDTKNMDEGVQMGLRLIADGSPSFSYRSVALANLKSALLVRRDLPLPLLADWAAVASRLPAGPRGGRDPDLVEVRALVDSLLARNADLKRGSGRT